MKKNVKSICCTAVLIAAFIPALAFSQITANLNYERSNLDSFKGELQASDLNPTHQYILTINGKKNHSSNEKLKELCEIWEPTDEGYCDFDKVSTDDKGNLSVKIDEELPKGRYRIKFLIKDTANSIVVWSDDLVNFTVE
jgi:hypothetical protein